MPTPFPSRFFAGSASTVSANNTRNQSLGWSYLRSREMLGSNEFLHSCLKLWWNRWDKGFLQSSATESARHSLTLCWAFRGGLGGILSSTWRKGWEWHGSEQLLNRNGLLTSNLGASSHRPPGQLLFLCRQCWWLLWQNISKNSCVFFPFWYLWSSLVSRRVRLLLKQTSSFSVCKIKVAESVFPSQSCYSIPEGLCMLVVT